MNRLLDAHRGDKPSSQCKDGRNAERRGSHENTPLKNPGAAFVQRVRLVLSGYDESATSALKCLIRAKLSQRVGLSPDKSDHIRRIRGPWIGRSRLPARTHEFAPSAGASETSGIPTALAADWINTDLRRARQSSLR